MAPRERIVLRSLAIGDAKSLASWGQDDEFCRAAGWTVGRPLRDLMDLHERLIASPPPGLLRLAVCLGDRLVGYVDVRGEGHDRELGYAIGERAMWGRGLGTAAADAGLALGFSTLGLTAMHAEVAESNERSVRILRSLGMSEDPRSAPLAEEVRGVLRFTITADQWRSHSTAIGAASPTQG